jgi:P4 family phage/plasmid primase-like protien
LENRLIETVFGDLPTNPPSDIFDRSVIAINGWFLYGACKPDKVRYKNTKMYILEAKGPDSFKLLTDSLETYTNRELIDLLSIRKNHTEENFCDVRPEIKDEWKALVAKWSSSSASTEPRPLIRPPIIHEGDQQGGSMETPEQSVNVRAAYTKEEIKMAFKFARECLNPEVRARSYHKWVELALCLRNISDEEEALTTWIDISRRVPGYEHTTDTEFFDKWTALRRDYVDLQKQIKMGTLYHWARLDNPKRYDEIRNEDVIDYAYNHDIGTHVQIANLMFRIFRHEYRNAPNLKSYDWYHFQDHTWHSIKQPMNLQSAISNRVKEIYVKAQNEANARWLATTDEGMKKVIDEKRKNLQKLELQLESSPFKTHVMKELTEKFYQEDFKDHIDADVNLVGVANGVLVLNARDENGNPCVQFRPGKPDDFISLQMGKFKAYSAISYVKYDPLNPHNKGIIDFFKKLFPRDDLREYVLTLLAACLEGKNREQRFYVFQGEGSNGKSAIIRFMEMIFGEYQVQVQATMITRKQNDSGTASPQVIMMRNKRFVHMQEPEDGEKINSSLMKQLSGEDMISARGLYKDQENFNITARLFLCCNRLPPVNSLDNGTWRRLRVIKFESEFRDSDKFKGPEDEERQAKNNIFKKDVSIETSETYGFKAWRQAMLSLLVHYYETIYLVKGLVEPDCVFAESKKYKEENDNFSSFMDQRLISETGAETGIKEIMDEYKEWLSLEGIDKKQQINKTDTRQKLIEKYGKPKTWKKNAKEYFCGVRIAGLSEDISGNFVNDSGNDNGNDNGNGNDSGNDNGGGEEGAGPNPEAEEEAEPFIEIIAPNEQLKKRTYNKKK